jgi:hypothetical protein
MPHIGGIAWGCRSLSADAKIGAAADRGETMFGRFARILMEALDCAACALSVGRLCLFDLIHGPEPATPADKERELDHERLWKAFQSSISAG